MNIKKKIRYTTITGRGLEQILKDNKNKLSVSSNGFVSVNMNSQEARDAIKAQLKTLNKLHTCY
jgi:hypothetical protein